MKKRAFLNFAFSITSQLMAIISGLIIPRLILSAFGSETNGLVGSINQFLNYIALVEGGLGSVVIASLYSPLAKKDNMKLNAVLNAANGFFKKIAYIFAGYAVILGILYPIVVKSEFTHLFVFSLSIILAVSQFVQYFFSISYKLLLQADQRMYIIQIVQIITTILNMCMTYLVIKIFPSIHLVKISAALVFAIQPVVYNHYVNKHYHLDKTIPKDDRALSQRWDCFGQNFAFFIHSNTDIVVLLLFRDLVTVSVYSVYNLVVANIKGLILSISNAFTPIIGLNIARNDTETAKQTLDIFEYVVFSVSTIIFGSCLYLLPSFVMIYTKGINDADYYQPVFSVLIVLAQFVCCTREPYMNVVHSAGKFKETSVSAYCEAIINIGISIALVFQYGLIGIAIGTLCGMIFRMFYQVWYIHNNILYRSYLPYIKRMMLSIVSMVFVSWIMNIVDTTGSTTVGLWIKNGAMCVLLYTIFIITTSLLFDKKLFTRCINNLLRRKMNECKK